MLNILVGIGRVAAGLVGIAGFGPSYPGAVAAYQGGLLGAYELVFPDHTVDQMNRLNDVAYEVNTVVPKRQSKVLVVFLPQRLFMSEKQRKMFWKEPTLLWDCRTPEEDRLDFRKIDIRLEGKLITEALAVPPVLTDIFIDQEEMARFEADQPAVEGYLIGRFLTGAEITLTDAPEKVQIKKRGASTDNRIEFIVESGIPVPAGTRLTFRVTKGGASQEKSLALDYTPSSPTIDDHEITAENMKRFREPGADVPGVLKGKNLAGANPKFEPEVPGLSIEKKGASTNSELQFLIRVTKSLPDAQTALKVVVENVNHNKSAQHEILIPKKE